MLAQNFKTAADLGIIEKEQTALIKLLGMLEREEVVHVQVPDDRAFYDEGHEMPTPKDFTGLFNMGNVFTLANCGTAACMAGTSDWVCGTNFAPNGTLRSLPAELDDLFCPDEIDDAKWCDITTRQAASALRNYLTTGEARWDEVLG